MNMNRLINMGVRMLMHKGADLASRGGKRHADMSVEERQAARRTRQNTQKAQRGMNILRRFMR